MSNEFKDEINKIEIPKELSKRSALGISEAKKDMKKREKQLKKKRSIWAAIALIVLSISGTILFTKQSENELVSKINTHIVKEDGSIDIPVIQLPDNMKTASIIGLIVYKGNIYTQANTTINYKDAKKLLGEKIGRTKGIIDEWSEKDVYKVELASPFEGEQVYKVKGYDENFRIMTYNTENNDPHVEFYEHLNGITVQNGKDIFSKLKMTGNMKQAVWRSHSNWNEEIEKYHAINSKKTIQTFIDELNHTKPVILEGKDDPFNSEVDDEHFKELVIELQDGSKTSLILFKEGYIYYGHMYIYFKMDETIFDKMWNEMK